MKKVLVKMPIALALSVAPVHAEEPADKHSLIDAGKVAYVEFAKALDQRSEKSNELAIYLSSIENYKFTLQQNEDFYIVLIEPVFPPGEIIFGGGREYRISKKDLRIVQSVGYK